MHCIISLVCLTLASVATHAQDRRVAFGIGIESSAKAQLIAKTGSPYGLRGGYAIRAALQTLPSDEYGFRSGVSIAYAVDEARYNYAPSLVFSTLRYNVRTEVEALIPTRGEVVWLMAGIGVDWNVGTFARLSLYGPGQVSNLAGEPALNIADLDLFRARRLLVPFVRLGPALHFPLGDGGKAAWLQLFVRQDFLNSHEAPVAVAMPDASLRPQTILVGQKPTHFGLLASYFF
jgi:hypothetical protein